VCSDESSGDDADCFTAGGEHRVGDDAHQADTGAAVHQSDAAVCERPAKRSSGVLVVNTDTVARSRKDAYSFHFRHGDKGDFTRG